MDELKKKIKALLEKARAVAAKAEEENNREFTDEERKEISDALTEVGKLKAQLKKLEDDAALTKAIGDLGEGLEIKEVEAGKPKALATAAALAKGLPLGEAFTEHPDFKAWLKTVARPDGTIPDSLKGFRSQPVNVPDLVKALFTQKGSKAIITGGSATSGGAFVETDYTGIFVPIVPRRITVLDLISRRTTGSDTVEFVRQTSRTNNAAPVAEASGAADSATGLKPEGDMAFEKVTATVKTIAEWVAITKRALADAGQLRGIIDQQLRADLESEVEDQVMNGSGAGEDLEGLENTAGTLSQAFVTDLFTTTRRAKTFAQTAEEDGGGGFEPTAYVLNPEDWEAIELTQDANLRYYGEGPFRNTPQMLWQIPVVTSPKVPQGKGWLGKWTDYVVWDREQASISVSDSPYNFFVRNLVAVLAELRVAGAAIRPKSFIEIALGTGT